MHPLIIPTLVTIAGLYFMVRNIVLLRDESKLKDFLNNDPRGKFWASKLGQEKLEELSRKYLLPLGIVISLGMLGVGIWSLSRLLTSLYRVTSYRLTCSWSGRYYSCLVWLRQASSSVKHHSTWC